MTGGICTVYYVILNMDDIHDTNNYNEKAVPNYRYAVCSRK